MTDEQHHLLNYLWTNDWFASLPRFALAIWWYGLGDAVVEHMRRYHTDVTWRWCGGSEECDRETPHTVVDGLEMCLVCETD